MDSETAIEYARQIVHAARDATLDPNYKHPQVNVRFKRTADAQQVIDCLNERYGGVYADIICVIVSD